MCTVSFRLINYMIFHFHSIPIHSPILRGCVIYGELQSKCLSYNVMVIRNKLHDRWVIEMCVIPYQQQHQRQDEYITATMVIVTKCYQMTSPCKLVVINYIIFHELILYRRQQRQFSHDEIMMMSSSFVIYVQERTLIGIDHKRSYAFT